MKASEVLKYILGIVILLVVSLFSLIGIYGDFLWFQSIGFDSVFITILSSKIIYGFLAFMFFLVILYGNWRIVLYILKREGTIVDKSNRRFAFFGILFIAFLAGMSFSSQWDVVLKFLNFVRFGIQDPVFAEDISYYVFNLPFFKLITGLSLWALIMSVAGSLAAYLFFARPPEFKGSPEDFRKMGDIMYNFADLKESAKNHLSILSGFVFFLIGVWAWLSRFDVLFSEGGAVFGAAYTDITVILPLLTLVSIMSGIIGVLFLIQPILKRLKFPVVGIGILMIILIVGGVASSFVQQFQVEPDEYNMEKPYIQRNINYTLRAFGLNNVEEVPFEASYNMSFEGLMENNQTLENVRLWDYRALKDTYSQLQLIRTYYDFNDVDVDRYHFEEGGEEKYSQVMLSPRELDQNDISLKARTWVNQHLVYTHGYGFAMSPVSKVSEEGLPEFWVKDIPPISSKGFDIERPEIYFGEKTNQYVVTNTNTEEFDYPRGGDNEYTNYEGSGGVSFEKPLSRLAFSTKFGSLKLLISNSITSESNIMIHRNIRERLNTIAPFLSYDSDPYMVTSNGKLYWIVDAYSTTDKYAYSEKFAGGRVNYLRNSVKVVVDAYNGEVTFYQIEDEPVVNTYGNMFPELFEDFSNMPEDLKKHIRYPQDLFKVQSEVYSTYHMEDPRVFYNKEDQWRIPNEVYSGNKIRVEPYYLLMDLPGEDKSLDFVMMTPFTPENKDNMIGWMGAKSDPSEYGEKIVYKFSKQELIYGPSQIEARIDQDTDISQKMTLWSQSGSKVIRGNLLIIPIGNSLLYVEPIFLQGTGGGSIPQLKRVIVAYGDKLAMRESLDKALEVVFKEDVNKTVPEEPGVPEEPTEPSKPLEGTLSELLDQASQQYEEAQELLKEGDFSGYAEKIEKVGEIIERINQLRANQTVS